jgi:hypothetical protein
LRTGVEFHYPPRFRVALQPGSFQLENDPGPFADALRPASAPTTAAPRSRDEGAASGLQALVDRFRNESGSRTVVGSLPVNVTFPAFGPSMFLASELTAEARALSVEFTFKRTAKRVRTTSGLTMREVRCDHSKVLPVVAVFSIPDVPSGRAAAAIQTPKTVTLALGEYNRLLTWISGRRFVGRDAR